eukprot:scaffold69881_cov57-Phaeocystis_antarctica.AAC.2
MACAASSASADSPKQSSGPSTARESSAPRRLHTTWSSIDLPLTHEEERVSALPLPYDEGARADAVRSHLGE